VNFTGTQYIFKALLGGKRGAEFYLSQQNIKIPNITNASLLLYLSGL